MPIPCPPFGFPSGLIGNCRGKPDYSMLKLHCVNSKLELTA